MASQNRMWTRPLGVRTAVSLSAVVAYVLLFFPAYTLLGRAAIALAIVPLLVVATAFDLWGGLAMGLGLVPLNVLLFRLTEGQAGNAPGTDFWLAHAGLLASGMLVGHLRYGGRRLERQLVERQMAEQALQESETKYRNVVEQANDGIVIVQDGQIRYASRQMAEMLGLEVTGLVDRPFGPFIAPEYRELVQDHYVRRQHGEPVSSRYESALICANGSHIDVEINAAVMDYQGRPATLAVLRDMTERKAAEHELRKLLQAVEQSANAVVITDLDGLIEYANPKFTEITGYSVEEALGQNPRLLQSGEHDEEYYRVLWETILSGKEWRGEFHNKRKDGSLYWEEATIAPIRDETGTITHFVTIKEDITGRKEAEDQLAERLRFEALLSELSAAFTGLTSDQFEVEIARWMQRVSAFLGVDRSRLYRLDPDHRHAESVYAYSSDGTTLPASTVSRKEFSHVFNLVMSGKVFVASTPSELPVDAVEERAFFETEGVHALLVVPLQAGGAILGALVFASLKPQDNWPEDLIQRLRLVSEVFANALLRQQTEARLQRYAERLQVQHRLDQAILEAESAKATAQAALLHLSRIVPSQQSCVVEIDAASKRATCLVVRRSDGTFEQPAALSISLAEGVLDTLTGGQVLRTDGSTDVQIAAAFHQLLGHYATGPCLVVPLRAQGQLVGTMNLEISASDPFVETDLDVFREVADSLAIALHQTRLHEQTQIDAQVKANLLQEVNHRVSNNLTAIIGLMRAERRYARSQNRLTVEEMVERLSQRVEGMVEVHRLLSQSEWMPVRLDRLAGQVVGAALGVLASEQHVEVVVDESAVRVSPRQASNLALILNELTTNTIKHAMIGRAEGRIEVRISGEEQIRVEYRNDGPDYPDAVLALEQVDVGLYLVQQLVLGLPGSLELRNEGGAVTVIVFESEEGDRT